MRTLRTLLTGVLVLAPAVALPAAGAGAATCSSAGGVSVVVDYRELGGSMITECVPDGGGKSASAILRAAGVALSFATRQPGFVCRVNGVPTADPCVNTSPTDAYWGLFWAGGTTSTWTFSSSGVGGLTVPPGGSVGWSWQQDRAASGAVPPGVDAPLAPKPTPTPSQVPTATATPTTPPSTSPTSGAEPKPTTSPTTKPTPKSSPTRAPESPESSPKPGSAKKGERPKPSSPSASSTPSEAPSDEPEASGSPKDPSEGEAEDPTAAEAESPDEPGDSAESEDADPEDTVSEVAGSRAEPPVEPSASSQDAPARVPGWLLGVVGALLAAAIGVSAIVSRRRRA